ncbi:glutamine amidotransferase-like class 1 domain-containing protein 3, mitochondrial [Ostrea edulis]|uniref:glutamine amidotransferase-like class 1 domain-containing protein 3, mitochondrial n=1 Tax=Ostrea edulis TaxID=37623 RepID=UPI0024AF56DA|nr:glutamine amidotransferase-like class 1 domain-containing protein 3, mitochondrial [Ostrea edulis]
MAKMTTGLTTLLRSRNLSSAKKSFLHTTSILGAKNPKVALIFSGCGVYDGTEIHEASSAMVHLSRHEAEVGIFAPNMEQMHAIDHTKGEPMSVNRNVLVESARIARGKIEDLKDLNVKDYDAVIFPGGFGAAKNLSNFAVEGDKMAVQPAVDKVIKDFHSAKKPIGLCCISPVLAAKTIPGCTVTVGQDTDTDGKWPYAGTAGACQSMGAKHVNRDVGEINVDSDNKIVTTPAFMCETAVHKVFDGVGKMVEAVLKLCKS